MNERRDFADTYDPRAVMARVGHLPTCAQRDVERITRILRASFGYGGDETPERCRILSVALIGSSADPRCPNVENGAYDFRIVVSFPDCADETYWSLAKRIIMSEFGERHPVTLMIEPSASGDPDERENGIVLYDASSDMALNARELSSTIRWMRTS